MTKLFRSLIALALTALIAAGSCDVGAQTPVDTIYNPTILYSGLPKTYEIADIAVNGADNYLDYVIINYTGLKKGDRIEIPGDALTDAAKSIWRQQLFANVAIAVDKIAGDKVWLSINLRQQPRISSVRYSGVKSGEKKDIEEMLNLVNGNQITQNQLNRIESIIKSYFAKKGFGNATVKATLIDDLSEPGHAIVDIAVKKHDKVKVNRIFIDGNEVLSDNALLAAMKKTHEQSKFSDLFSSKIRYLFSSKKFVDDDYKDDLVRIIQKYNEKGYRDAVVVSDSVVPVDDNHVDIYITVDEGKKYYVNDISWVGNTVYSSDWLSQVLGFEKGQVYNQTRLEKRLSTDEDAVSNVYLDNGYLFSNIIPIEKNVRGDSIDIELRVIEGPQARINNVVINGNDRLYEKVIRRELYVRPGELFSKSDLMRSYREIAQTGHFNPENMDIHPEPNEDNGTVDIIFNLESKSNDQFEFSLGWGQTGIIGKVAIKFTNFSIKNLFYPSSYRGIIPQGEGQQLTLSAQTNARYYQAYSISFLDPWFGGKRPNALSVSAYYSRQTGVNSSFYNSRYMYNPYMYSYGGSYAGANDYYQSSLESAYDPNKLLQMIGISVGFGKRLRWPDDYFQFQAELTYNWYYLKNWEYLYYMNNGTSNAFVLGLTLARNSTDNPIYTRTGSDFSLSLHLTPPASLFGKKDWKKLSEENTTESKKQKYKWIEYWKLKFRSRTFTPLTNPQGSHTLVFMTRADAGLLGSYNKYLKSPFETFYVGGDGMSGSYTYAQETIALRGYDNGALTPYTREGYAYARLGMELHFPFLLQPTTTIYGLAFVEGGNAWTDIKQFNPFNLKRSAGVGVRIMLPMVGLMGIDWAYGFDKVFGERGGSHFHFILGQEF